MPGIDTDLGDSHASFWGERSDQRSSRFAGGDGSASNPFQVSNVYELQNVSNNMSSHYVLVNDIDASITAGWNGQRGFDPITAFNGTLDGQNFTVSNLTIDRSEDYVGLFGTIAQLGEVKNIGLVDVDVSGEQYVGALAGSNDNIVENCYSTGSVYGTDYLGGLVGDNDEIIRGSHSTCTVSGQDYVGGLVGWNGRFINECHSSGTVQGRSEVGGLVGKNKPDLSSRAKIDHCRTNCTVIGETSVGGLVGTNDDEVSNSYAVGKVTGNDDVAGLVGLNEVRVRNSYYNVNATQITGTTGVRDFGIYEEQFDDWLANDLTLDIDDYLQKNATDGFYELNDIDDLKAVLPFSSDGNSFRLMADMDLSSVPGFNIPVFADGEFDGGHHTLSNLKATVKGGPIGFIGLFGSLKGIANLTLVDVDMKGTSSAGGLIAWFFGSSVENCSVTGKVSGGDDVGGLMGGNYNGRVIENCQADVQVQGPRANIGGLVGSNYGTINDSVAEGSVVSKGYSSYNTGGLVGYNRGDVRESQATGSVSGFSRVGGLVGYNADGIVEYCEASGDVTSIENSWSVGGLIGYNSAAPVLYSHASGGVTGTNYVGGLVGQTYGSSLSDIYYCYATGDVTGIKQVGGLVGQLHWGSDIVQSFATGSVDGWQEVGGLVGSTNAGSIRDSYATGDVSARMTNVGGLVGDDRSTRIYNTYSVGKVTGPNNKGGLIGYIMGNPPHDSFWDIETSGMSNSAGGTGLNTADMKKEMTFTSATWDLNSTWGVIEGTSYPYLRVHYRGPSLPPELDQMREDNPYRFTIDPGFYPFPGTDNKGTLSLESDLGWLMLEPTGLLRGTPANSDVGMHWAEITVKALVGNATKRNYTLEVINTNDSPVITTKTVPDATEDEAYSVVLEASDVDPTRDVLTWEVTKTYTEFLELNVSTGELAGTPVNEDVGERWIEIRVSDGNGGSDKVFLLFDVINVNDDPVIDTTDIVSATEDKLYENIYTGHDVDPTNDELVWSMETNVPSLSMDAATGRLSGTLTNEEVGERWVNISLRDGNGGLTFTNFTLTVANVNDAPTITTTVLPDGTEDQPYEATVEAVDIDHPGDVLTWEILSTNADFLEIDPTTGIISGSPDNEDVGEWRIELQVSDGCGGNTTADLTFKIVNVNDAPEITTENVETVTQDEYYQVSYKGTDIDPTGDSLEWAVQTNAGFLTFHPTSGDLVGTPTNDDVGEWSVEVSVTDGRGGWAWSNFTLRVLNVNDAPHDALITASGDYIEGEDQQLNATASDPDIKHGDTLTFKWTSDISGDLGTGPSIVVSLPKGNHMITLTVTDSEGLSTTKSTMMEILPPKDDTSSSPGPTGIFAAATLVAVALVLMTRRRRVRTG